MVMATVRWSAVSLIHYSFFWIPVKPLQWSMLSKSTRCSESCNACSQHWSTVRVQFFPVIIPDQMSHNQHFKSWMICFIFHSNLTSRQLTATPSTMFTTFCRENASTATKMQKTLSKSSLNPEAQISMLYE